MTIDTSREAVERLLEGVTPGPWHVDGPLWNQIIWSSSDNRVCFMAHTSGLDDARDLATAAFIAAARELVPALLARAEAAEAERDRAMQACEQIASRLDAALAEVARLSTPPDDAEVADLVERLRDTAKIHENDANEAGEYRRVMSEELAKEARDAADALTRLSHAHAARRKE